MVEYRQPTYYVQWALAEGSEFLFPGVLKGGEKGNLALMPGQMKMTTISRPICGRLAWRINKRDEMCSFRVGGAASHIKDTTAMDALMNTWGGSPQPSQADTQG